MTGLIAFVTARLDEDEAAANEVHLPRECGCVDRDGEFSPDPAWCGCKRPARELREVAAKRAILAAHHPVDPCDAHDAMMRTIACDTLLLLALPYSDHPDYRAEWAPPGH